VEVSPGVGPGVASPVHHSPVIIPPLFSLFHLYPSHKQLLVRLEAGGGHGSVALVLVSSIHL
jgi:hypothetical protein